MEVFAGFTLCFRVADVGKEGDKELVDTGDEIPVEDLVEKPAHAEVTDSMPGVSTSNEPIGTRVLVLLQLCKDVVRGVSGVGVGGCEKGKESGEGGREVDGVIVVGNDVLGNDPFPELCVVGSTGARGGVGKLPVVPDVETSEDEFFESDRHLVVEVVAGSGKREEGGQ